MKQKNWPSGKTKLRERKRSLKQEQNAMRKEQSEIQKEDLEMKNMIAEKNLNKKAGRWSWENPPKDKVKRKRKR